LDQSHLAICDLLALLRLWMPSVLSASKRYVVFFVLFAWSTVSNFQYILWCIRKEIRMRRVCSWQISTYSWPIKSHDVVFKHEQDENSKPGAARLNSLDIG
jgi:hypothetical protein